MYDRPPTGTVAAAEDAAPSTRATGSDVVLSPWQLLLPENSSNVTFPVGAPCPPDTVTVSCTEEPIGADAIVLPSAFLISVSTVGASFVAARCSQTPLTEL